ncbi:DHS-like NAD/FAD-binding domain-containing protein [Marasmius fiardii PR-910]|nr:DHS-like NAD/FAD-binding domain-containing protein [Marasmius fiardii PR-910]
MTLFLPLEADAPLPTHPSFLLKPLDTQKQVSKAIKAILKAKRVVVVCGAGISVHAGIPDFRSPEGLFQTLKRDNPREALTSGKDLFDASVFNSEHTTSLFCQMICQLSDLSKSAQPTPFHKFLKALDNSGKLLRVYTQNIDAIEEKSGLSFGVPDFESKRFKTRPKEKDGAVPSSNPDMTEVVDQTATPSVPSSSSTTTPRCIPLHGTLQNVHCQICNHSYPLDDHLPSLNTGIPPDCPECTSMKYTRQLIGKRARGVGKLRPSVVLYNEAHKDGEGVGEVVRRDLVGSSKGKGRSGADLLLVVGTSLRVPGTKRMVREFAKAVHSRGSGSSGGKESGNSSHPGSSSTSPAPGKEDVEVHHPMKAIYLNLDFPVPTREWEGVFDVWLQGDAQKFGETLQEEIRKETMAKEVTNNKKKKKAMESGAEAGVSSSSDLGSKSSAKKRKVHGDDSLAMVKRKKMQVEVVIPPFVPHPTPQTVTKKKRSRTATGHTDERDISSHNDHSAPKTHREPYILNLKPSLLDPAAAYSSPPSTPLKQKPRTITSPSFVSFSVGRPPPTPELSPRTEAVRPCLDVRRSSTCSLSSLSSLSSVPSSFPRESSPSSVTTSSTVEDIPDCRQRVVYKADEMEFDEESSQPASEEEEWEGGADGFQFSFGSTWGKFQFHPFTYQSRIQTSCIRTTQLDGGG